MADKSTLARRHAIASIAAPLAFCAWIATHSFDAPRAFGYVGIVVLMAAIIVMFMTRKADEYVASLWSAGANAAFLAVVAYFLFGPAAEGFFDGLTGNESGQDLPSEAAVVVALVAFFAGYFWKRVRGAY